MFENNFLVVAIIQFSCIKQNYLAAISKLAVMQKQHTMTQTLNQIDEKVVRLNLSKIKFKLLHGDEKSNWTEELCNIAEEEYKKFLTLILLYPDKKIVPNKLMDAIWHQHILDTKKYAFDCSEIFGHFLHHNPYYGLTSLEEFQVFQNDFENTTKLYAQTFGTDMKNNYSALCDSDGSNCVSTGGDE